MTIDTIRNAIATRRTRSADGLKRNVDDGLTPIQAQHGILGFCTGFCD